MASSNGKENSKMTASIDSLKLSSKNASVCSSKHASSESVLSRKDKECLQMQECKKKLLAMEPQIIIRDENVVLRSPPQKKIVMPPTINPEELAAATPTQRNWRGILIALLVIAAVLGLIVFSIALLTPAGDGGRVRGRRPTLQDVLADHYKPFNGTWLTVFSIALLTPAGDGGRVRGRRPTLQDVLADHYKPFNGTWLTDEELVFRDRWGGLTLFNVRNYTTRLLMNNSTFRELNAVDFKVSADLKFVLLISDVRPGWRHARLARYHVYDVINRNKIPISPVEDDRSAPLLQYAEWSPTGSSLVFVHDNDIYYKPRVLKTLVCRITNTGVPGVIFNGVPDFLYETEVLRLDRALWFSPDGQTLLYASYNDSLVQQYKYPWYGFDQPEPPAYPSIRTLRYPKVNTNNPVVTVYVVSLKTPKFLFPHAIQFTSQVDKNAAGTWRHAVRVTHDSRMTLTQGNFEVTQLVGWDERRKLLATLKSHSWWDGTRGGNCCELNLIKGNLLEGTWRHAVRVTHDSRMTLTQGNFEVTQLVGWDERRKLLYVIGTAPDKAGERHLYRVKVPPDASTWPEPAACLTCPGAAPAGATTEATSDEPVPPDASTWPEPAACLTCPGAAPAGASTEATSDEPESENSTSSLPAWPTSTVLPHVADENDSLPAECLYNRIMFSKNFSYYVQECLGPGPPAAWVRARDGSTRALLWGGEALRHKFAQLAQPQVKVFRVEVQTNREARVRLLLPPGFRETDDLPLPLVLQVSAQPGGQLVTERWKPGWSWYLAAARNFIVAEIDARGSGGQGEELRTEIYNKLLTVDVEDQIAVLSYLRDNLKMVDGSRVGVWGRGYGGGAAAALAAGDARNVTRCLAALAPLTDLRHHNSYWTERYSGYGSWAGALGVSAVWRRAGNLPPRRLLLAHATADLTAPPHHALALARALIRQGAVYTHQKFLLLAHATADLTAPPHHALALARALIRQAAVYTHQQPTPRRLLLAHATADLTAPPHHALALARALIRQGAVYTHQVYPDEGHSFERSSLHLHKAMEQFFDECFGPVEVADWDAAGVGGLFPFRD
ncbi:venom dipeptidyl peptidase 4-like [Ostrinia nubilalis]|uniref:venom dipeptidyl peptidase 4-like n=1 Tax=Ostrinia nubilalis TaxID=29057 RepID=UPI003082238C